MADWLVSEFGLLKFTRQVAVAGLLDADAFVAAFRAALPRRRALSAAELKAPLERACSDRRPCSRGAALSS